MTQALHTQQYRPDAPVPLDGIRIVDISRLVAGNMVTHVLADHGAEVIKIEDPRRGDDLRNWLVDGIPTYWKVYARNKKSLALNYRTEAGLDVLHRLIATAQMLVENFVPGKLERIGLAPEMLLEINPRLVIVRISGWGQTGPFKDKPGFGSLVEAMCGYASMNGFPDRPPVLPPLALADMVTGLYGASAAMIALRHVEVSGGRGQVVDLSLFEPMLSILGPEAANHALTGRVTPRHGSRSATTAPRNVYRCRDGKYVALSASMQSMAERLFQVMGRADLLEDERFRTNTARVRHIDVVDGVVAEFMGARTQAEILDLFGRTGVTVGPVCDAADLVVHPYVVEREALITVPDADMGELPMHNVTPRMSETGGALRSPAPTLGEHSAAILASLGIDPSGIEQLRRDGAIL
ncbi:MAG: CoA transferase [Acidisphaera sp.]|nr:CoA transferase [Acidisphaera sp.]